jgi:phosphatidylglycerophosphate synthase
MTVEAPTPAKADCYSHAEREAMVWTQELRGWLLRPLLARLHALRISGDHVTFTSLLAGAAFVPLWIAGWPLWALAALAAHALLDGLDGPLARYAGTASRRGSFTDSTADQIVIALVTLALIATGAISGVVGGAYIFLYTLVVAFAMIRNALTTPYSWLFRPRFLVYAWILIEALWWLGSLEFLLWGCCALLACKLASGFVAIRCRL